MWQWYPVACMCTLALMFVTLGTEPQKTPENNCWFTKHQCTSSEWCGSEKTASFGHVGLFTATCLKANYFGQTWADISFVHSSEKKTHNTRNKHWFGKLAVNAPRACLWNKWRPQLIKHHLDLLPDEMLFCLDNTHKNATTTRCHPNYQRKCKLLNSITPLLSHQSSPRRKYTQPT